MSTLDQDRKLLKTNALWNKTRGTRMHRLCAVSRELAEVLGVDASTYEHDRKAAVSGWETEALARALRAQWYIDKWNDRRYAYSQPRAVALLPESIP